MTAPELKPCPFCGAEAHMLGGPMAQDRYEVWCKSKGRRHHVNGTMDAHQTAAIWNTRADLRAPNPRTAALVEAVAKGPMLGEDMRCWIDSRMKEARAALAAWEA